MQNRLAPLHALMALSSAIALVRAGSASALSSDPYQDVGTEVKELLARVGPPSKAVARDFRMAGMRDIEPHKLTDSERAHVAAALASLPTPNRRILERRLHRLSFIDGIPGEGTALTSQAAAKGLYDITIRAGVLNESLSTFLTTKEQRVFTPDNSGIHVALRGTDIDAITYLLLHESTHVLDFSCNPPISSQGWFSRNVWLGPQTMVSRLASSASSTTYFHGGHPRSFREALTLYDALAQSPFVTLYATASEPEDLAELVAWRELMKQHGGNLVIEIKDSRGNTLRRFDPLSFAAVKKRFREVDKLLASGEHCSSPS